LGKLPGATEPEDAVSADANQMHLKVSKQEVCIPSICLTAF
jgi:hypothetical protein